LNLTPEIVEAIGKAASVVITAGAAGLATVISAAAAFWSYKAKQKAERAQHDLHIAHDRIRNLKGEPLQHREKQK
jgi:hypothetical protein